MENETSGASEERREVKTSLETFIVKGYHGIREIPWELRREIPRDKQISRMKKEQRKNVGHNLLEQVNSDDLIDQVVLRISQR